MMNLKYNFNDAAKELREEAFADIVVIVAIDTGTNEIRGAYSGPTEHRIIAAVLRDMADKHEALARN